MPDSFYLFPFYLLLCYGCYLGVLKLAYPIAVFVHEMGHALPALLLSAGTVTVYVGDRECAKIILRIGRFAFMFHPRGSEQGTCLYDAHSLQKRSKAIVLFGGLVASALAAIALFIALWIESNMGLIAKCILGIGFIANLRVFIAAVIPQKIHEKKRYLESDARALITLFKKA